jgi:hypothetical protein
MSNPVEKATVYLSKLEANRMAAMALCKEKSWRLCLSKHGRKDLEKLWEY